MRYVYSKGQAVRSQQITIKWVSNSHRKNPRFSVVVSKKVFKGAVGRNRIRRRVYEYLRQNTENLNNIYDIVVIITSSEIRTIPSQELYSNLDQLFSKANLYKTDKS